jgi:hypothetical protein
MLTVLSDVSDVTASLSEELWLLQPKFNVITIAGKMK